MLPTLPDGAVSGEGHPRNLVQQCSYKGIQFVLLRCLRGTTREALRRSQIAIRRETTLGHAPPIDFASARKVNTNSQRPAMPPPTTTARRSFSDTSYSSDSSPFASSVPYDGRATAVSGSYEQMDIDEMHPLLAYKVQSGQRGGPLGRPKILCGRIPVWRAPSARALPPSQRSRTFAHRCFVEAVYSRRVPLLRMASLS